MSFIHGKYELTSTNFNHPDITTGQHTNGAAIVWVRVIGERWLDTGEKRMHKVVAALDEFGDAFIDAIDRSQPK